MSTKNEKPEILAEQMAKRKAESAQGKKEEPVMLRHQPPQTTSSQPTSGQSTATATEPYVYEAKTSRRSTGLTPADQQKAIDKATPKPRAQAEQPQVQRDATNYTPAVKQRQPIQTPLEKKKEESQANATPIKIMEAEALGIDKYNYDMELPQEFVNDFGRGGIDKLFEHVDMSQDDDYNESLLQAAIKYVNATYPNEGVIEFNGKKYDKGSLAMSLVPLMRERGHEVLMRNNAKYRDDWAAKQGFGNFNVWLAAQDSELAKLEEEISKAWKDRASDNMGWKMAARGTLGHVFPIINFLPFIDRDASGVKHIRDLRDAIKLMRNGDYTGFDEFMKGAEEGFDYMNMLSFGMSGLAADTMRNRVLDKAYNGEELTPDEERILNIYKKEQEIRGYDHNAGSMTRQLGNIMGYMGQELPQYIWGGKIAGGVLKAGAKYMPNVVKGVVAATRGNKAVAPLRWGLKATGDYGAGLVAAPFLPGTYERFVEKRNEQYSIEDGKLKKDPTSALKDALSVWFEQAGEIGSELTGARMADFLDSSLLSLGSEVGVYKWLNKITPTIGGVETSKALRYAKSTSHRAAQQAAQYSGGVVTEGLGEAWGSFTAEVMKEAVLGEGNFEQFTDAEFWALTFGASGLAGLGFDAPTTAMDWVDYYRDLRTLSGTKKNAISKVEHTDLKNALLALSAGGNIKESTEHLANLDWENGGYSLEEIGYAMDYIRAEAMQQVRMGEATESERLQRFGKVAQAINNITYHNEVGKATDSIISAMDKEGNTYYILEGDITNPEAMLKALNGEGKIVSLLASNVSGYSKASVAETSQHYYREMFSTEFNMQRLESAEYAIERMDNPTMEQVANVAKRVGIVMPKEGDTITLVDKRTAKVTSVSDELGIMVEMTDGKGNLSVVPIPIMQILSSNTYIAEAQELQNAEDALELAQAEEAQMEAQDAAEENAEATSGMEETTTEKVAGDGLIGTEVTLPNGNKGTIVEVDGDDVVVDTGRGVDAYEVYSKEELGMTEAAEITTPQPTQTTAEQTTSETTTEQTTGEVTPEQATEALNEIAGIKPVPTLEDGSIDYDAIDDAETFAKHFEHDMGGREEAIEGVKEMREQAMADLAEAEKKGKKARSANDKVANKKLREQLAERIAFYDNVLDVYSPKAETAAPTESVAEADTTPSTAEVAEVAETTPQTMEAETTATPQEAETRTEAAETTEEVAEEEVLSAEEIWAAERREGYAVPDQNGQLIGLVHNELSEQLEKSVRILLNDVATAFGISVVFQREVRSSAGNLVNGKIDGTTVYFNWGKREHILTWLMGHEFTHRMKSLAPEAYNKLRDAVRKFMGEKEWEFRIEEQRKKHEERENPEEILSFAEREAIGAEAWEQTKREDGSYDTEAAKKLYNKKVAEARREAYIEEVVCDEVGVLARDHKAFDRFLRSEHVRNDGKFLRWLRKVWQSLMNAFSHDARTFNEVMKTLDELIDVSTAEVAKGVEPTKGGENNSLIGEVGAKALDRAEEATIRLDNLNIARQMEERGDSALDIRMATGWERGADGLWRYEIMDAEVNLYDGDEDTIRKKIEVAEEEEKDFMQQSKADTKELRERTNRYLAEMREKYGVAEGEETDVMTEEEIAHLQSLTGKEVAFEDYKERRRNELYNRRMALEAQLAYVIVKNTDAPAMILTSRLGHVLKGEYAEQLFKAYPSLKDMEFRFVTDIQQRAFAAYAIDGGKPYIELNVKKTPVNMVAPYLMHEVQHAIQAIEGFAEGGSPAFLNKKLSDRLNAVTKELEKLRAEGKTEEADALVRLNKGLAEAVINNDTDDYGNYQKLMGEVEARNVSARINMTPEERRATLLSETEDVAREDQIFLRDGVEMAMAEAENVKSEYRLTKHKTEEIFGGIWIADKKEFAKFASSVDTSSFEEDGEGIAFTDNYFYAYYRNIDGQVIPYASVYLNRNDSQDVVNESRKEIANVRKGERAKFYFDRAVVRFRTIQRENNANNGNHQSISLPVRNSGVVRRLLRKGRYYDNPHLYVKTPRTDGRRTLKPLYSLITPEMDASYLDAVERGDMATAQKMVMEAAKLAMPNTKVVDENGNPKVVYHQTNHSVYINRETGQNWDELDWRERMEWDERDDWDDYWEEQEFNTFSRVNARTTQELDGFFFAPEYDEYHEYGDRTIEAFLNIENPASFGDYNIDSSKTNAGRDERIRLQNEGYDGVINEEDGAIWEYIAFEPNQIKSADPVTYDDAGNVIPLSERFNPRKEDIRYSLIGEMGASNIESYGRYGSPAYALEQARDMETDGKSVKEIRVATNWERGKDGKWRYEINDGVYTDPEDKEKEYKLSDILKNDALYEAYPELADMPVYYAELEGNKRGMYDGEAIWLRKTLDEQQAHSTLEHEVQHAIQHREGFARGGNKGMFEQEAIEKLEQTLGDLEKEKDKFKSYNKLRKAYLILKYVANSLRLDRAESKAYEQYRRLAGEVEARNVQARMNMSEEERLLIPIGSTEDVARSSQNVIQRELMAADGTRYSLREESAPTRYSLQSGDMPFFNDNGDIITFDNTDITGEDYDAVELRSPMPTTPRTTKDVIKAHLSARHNAAKERIRRESRVLRDAVRRQYREEQVRRREGVETMRTNAAKVDYIIGAPIETLDYEAQVLAKIATGTLSISWESLKKELGVKDGDKRSYRHITNGATATLDAVVHDWWQDISGHERDIDTQDLRNALIDVLMQVPTAKGALSILEDRFDHALRNRDEALEDIDREEERLIDEEDARYNEQMTTLSDPARMREYIRQYEQTVGFHEELTAIEGTLRKMDSELKAVRKRAERAQMRNKASKHKQFDKSKEIIGKQKEFYKDKLAEQRASFKEVREAITESKRALLEALSTYEQLGFNKQEVRSLVDAVNKARSMADINKVRVKIENVILNVSIREKRRHMDQMLNLRLPSGELVETWVSKQIHDGKMSVADGKRILADMFRGTNANGVRVAKYVDDETARVMDYLRKNLIVPNHGAHYKEKKDADGNVIGREYVPSREAEMGADVLLKTNNERCNKLLGKAVEGTITEEEKIELQARQLYEPYLFVANARAYVKGVRAEGEKLYEEIQRKKAELGDAYTKDMRDADYAALEANALHLVEAKTAYDDALTEYNETLSNVIMSGRDKLREFREAKEAHKAEVVNMAIRAIGGEARTISQPTVAEQIAAWNRTTIHSTYWTFDSTCREIDRFAPNGEGEFYKHFMGGMTKASNDFFTRTDNHIQDICDAVRRITGSKRDPRRALRAFMRKADMTTVGSITYKNDKGKMESLPLRISNALFTLAMWGQAQYREIMEKRGITKEQMEALKAKIESIDGRYIDFMEWVIDSFLPSTRLEYNEVHKQLFGASMDNIENYFPAKVVEGYRDEDIAKVDSGLPSTMTGSIITRQKHDNMPQFDQSFFSVLLNHIQNMDQWASFSPLVEDLNAVISNPEFKRLVNTHMAGVNDDRTGKGSLWQIFKDTSAVAIGSYSCKTPDADNMISKLTGAWAASNISWRFSTALKQLSGLTAVAVSGLGKTQGMFLKNIMLSPLAVKWAMENSPMLQKRFGDRFAGNEALLRKYGQKQANGVDLRKGKLKDGLERVNDFIRFLTVDVGMTPNAAVDALVVAITMKTVYDVELSNLTKGKPESATEEQKSYAMMKAEIFANETQQSAEGAYLSVPQAQRSVITAALTTYLNASFASHRLRVQGVQDIYRWMSPKYRKEIDDRYGKGAARKAAGKGLARLLTGLSIDATFILMSRAVGQGLWRLIIDWFDDTEDNDDEADPIDWSDIGWEIGLNVAFGGLLGGTIVTTLGNGFTFTPIPALDELKKDVFKALGWTDKKIKDGDWSIDLNFWALGEIIFKYGYGLDPETMLNIARGIEGICRDKDPMAAMKILNTPQSMVNIIAGPRRDNETAKEYVERRARLEVLFAQPKYSELYDDEGKFIGKGKYDVVGGAKDYRLKGLLKEYNERQRATVMSKYLSPSEVAEFERIDREYKAVVEPLGWKVGDNPVDDKVDKTGWRNIYPEGLRQEHYAALKGIATAAEQTRRAQDRWVGSDQGYADLVREEYNLREQLIAGRRSSYKAKTAKEKIDKIKRKEKANKKNKSQKK